MWERDTHFFLKEPAQDTPLRRFLNIRDLTKVMGALAPRA
jgi:hypothetical protein